MNGQKWLIFILIGLECVLGEVKSDMQGISILIDYFMKSHLVFYRLPDQEGLVSIFEDEPLEISDSCTLIQIFKEPRTFLVFYFDPADHFIFG